MEDLIQWVIIIGVAFFVASRFMPAKGVQSISTEEADNRLKDKNVQFVDVRTPGEYKTVSKKPFKNIPLSELSRRTEELDKDKEVMLLCQSGMRSMKAAKILKKQGFSKVTNVRGGLGSWG
ncbi:rhodanese-like domain-containing protein [Halobacillus yeomjeoni]|uniref:Rhodanese-like domain-containing protein n=1 Tax=Halobacillus yeomjeoni TaxID=311194 RepID=A0A931HTZ3_9BACI|nr:rhodanese-like domain-containing protein [Halobacillus yeomjeoni]MBH0229166.1 rhodanese-like domain-containing protein [Halobacillus yeomjeoni]